MSTTSVEAPAGVRAANAGQHRHPGRRTGGRHVLPHLFLGALVIYFLIPIWWLLRGDASSAHYGSSLSSQPLLDYERLPSMVIRMDGPVALIAATIAQDRNSVGNITT